MSEAGDAAFWNRAGETYVPTMLGVSPWNGRTVGGVAIAGLVAHAAERVPSPVAMNPVRATIDILGAMPMVPVAPRTAVLREGKRIQLVSVELEAQGRVWASARILRVRDEETPVVADPPTRPFPEGARTRNTAPWVEMIGVLGDMAGTGAGAYWVRFPVALVAGSPLSQFERAMMIADFTAGTSPVLPMAEWSLANLDITLHLARLPRGEWLLVDAVSETGGNGAAIAQARLSDRDGSFGRTGMSVFLDERIHLD